jgi:hypothetical protein
MSLVRLTGSHGRRHSASALIQPILESLTEGLDTPEVAEAKTLLDTEITA